MKGKGCRIKLEQVETLKLMCKIDMSFDDFFNTNGHITFVNKMAAFLNIEPTRIKIVKIIPGSVVLDLAISGDESEDGESADGGGSSGSGSSDKKTGFVSPQRQSGQCVKGGTLDFAGLQSG